MKIRNSLGNGIRGSSVTNFALRDSVVDNNGDDAATDEAGLHFDEPRRQLGVHAHGRRDSPEDNARVVNSSGTLSQLNVTDSTFRDTDTVSPGNNGLLLQADGGSITADVLGDTFLRNRANGLQVITNGTGSMDVEVDDSATKQSTFDDNNIGVSIAHNSSGTFSYAVRDLTIDGLNVAPGTGGSASPININLASAATTPMVGKRDRQHDHELQLDDRPRHALHRQRQRDDDDADRRQHDQPGRQPAASRSSPATAPTASTRRSRTTA